MKDEELPEGWPGEPIGFAGVMRKADGTLLATVNGVPSDSAQLPELVAKLEKHEGRDGA